MSTNLLFKEFYQFCKKNSDTDWGRGAKRYLKSPFEFYGVRSPLIAEFARGFYKQNKDISKKKLWFLVEKLWQGKYHEERFLAMKLLRCCDLDFSDLMKLEKMLSQSVNWDQVDEISIHLIGTVYLNDPQVKKLLQKLALAKNFWLRRAAVISHILLFRKQKVDLKFFFKMCDVVKKEDYQKDYFIWKQIDEKMGRFFIRKGIGWALRECSKKYPQEVKKYLLNNKKTLSGLTFREGGRRF